VQGRKLRLYEKKHRGQRGFVIGGGPSIRDISPEIVEKLKQEITVGSNHAFKLFEPTYLIFIDRGYWRTFNQDLKSLQKTIMFYPSKLTSVTIKNALQFPMGSEKNHPIAPEKWNDRVPTWNNAGVTAIRIANIMGLNPIYLLGCDLDKDAKRRGETHFHDCYDEKRKNATKPERYDKFKRAFVKTIAAMPKVEIVSCSKVSALNEYIPYVSLESVL